MSDRHAGGWAKTAHPLPSQIPRPEVGVTDLRLPGTNSFMDHSGLAARKPQLDHCDRLLFRGKDMMALVPDLHFWKSELSSSRSQ